MLHCNEFPVFARKSSFIYSWFDILACFKGVALGNGRLHLAIFQRPQDFLKGFVSTPEVLKVWQRSNIPASHLTLKSRLYEFLLPELAFVISQKVLIFQPASSTYNVKYETV